jgi:BASS family bile acid:Na+ symporter
VEGYEQLAGPFILFPLMFVVGLQLVVDDFRRVLAAPRAVVGGTLGQLVLLPLLSIGVASAVGITPMMTAGAILLAATPGAGMSNVAAAVGRANVALSVTLTALASLLAVVTLPALAALGISVFVGDDLEVDVPVATLMIQLIVFLALPIATGMWVRARRPEASKRYVSRANRIAVIGILVATVLGALTNQDSLPGGAEFAQAALAGSLWTVCAMAIGWGLASLLDLDADDRFTFLIEFSARNIAMTIIVAVASLGSLGLGVFAAAYSMTGFPLVLLLAILRGRLARK